MNRSLFDWQLPPGMSIEQSFSSRPAENGYHLTWENRFTAVCDACGARTKPLAARADAIDELENHACSEPLAVAS